MILGLSKGWGKGKSTSLKTATDCFKNCPHADLEKKAKSNKQIKGTVWPHKKAKELKGEVRRSTNPSICDDMHKHNAQPLT